MRLDDVGTLGIGDYLEEGILGGGEIGEDSGVLFKGAIRKFGEFGREVLGEGELIDLIGGEAVERDGAVEALLQGVGS